MKTLVLFYSYSGKTKALAQKFAAETSADIAEIKEVKFPSKAKAYSAGIVASIRGKEWPILPLELPNKAELAEYDSLLLLAPVWAGNPPPAFNAALRFLPPGKKAAVKMVSASGISNCRARIETAVKRQGCTLEGFENIKA